MLAALHMRGKDACGKPAFWMEPCHVELGPLPAEWVVNVNGSVPRPGDPIVCGSCGKNLSYVFIEDYGVSRKVRRAE